MYQTFIQGTRVPVTRVLAGPCVVTQIIKEDTNGYWAIQLGFGEKKTKNIKKPQRGHLKDAITKEKMAPRFLREVRLDKEPNLKVGDKVKVSDFISSGDSVSVTGTTKGKGFAGVVKRWGFAGGPRTHGQSDRQRAPGSIGQGTTPGRVHKGKKMPGRMGGETMTIKNLKVVSVDPEKNEIELSGSVPGANGSFLVITKIASGELRELVKEGPKAQVVEGKPEGEPSDAEAMEGKEEVVKSEGGKE